MSKNDMGYSVEFFQSNVIGTYKATITVYTIENHGEWRGRELTTDRRFAEFEWYTSRNADGQLRPYYGADLRPARGEMLDIERVNKFAKFSRSVMRKLAGEALAHSGPVDVVAALEQIGIGRMVYDRRLSKMVFVDEVRPANESVYYVKADLIDYVWATSEAQAKALGLAVLAGLAAEDGDGSYSHSQMSAFIDAGMPVELHDPEAPKVRGILEILEPEPFANSRGHRCDSSGRLLDDLSESDQRVRAMFEELFSKVDA